MVERRCWNGKLSPLSALFLMQTIANDGERIELARRQLEQADEFDHVIENDVLERAAGELTELVAGLVAPAATMPGR